MRKTLAAFTALLCASLVGCADGSAGVGIIGGVDGPTAILIASEIWGVIAAAVVAVAIIAFVAVLVFKHRP